MMTFSDLEKSLKKETKDLLHNILNEFSKVYAALNEKDRIINTKNIEVTKLKDKIQELTEELKKSSKRCLTLENSLKQLQKEVDEFKNAQSNGQLIIIYSPEDAFNYSEQIVRKYINTIDFKKMDFEKEIELLEYLINYKKWDITDKVITNIIDEKLKCFTETNFHQFVMLIEKYIDKQREIYSYSAKSVLYFINKVNELRWTELLQRFIDDKHKDIENLVAHIVNEQEKNRFIIEIMRTYFLLGKDQLTVNWIQLVLGKGVLINEEQVENNILIEMLFIATYYEKDILLFDTLISAMDKVMHINLPEIESYKLYNEGMENVDLIDDCLKKIIELQKISHSINYDVKEKVFSKMCANLRLLKKENEKKQTHLEGLESRTNIELKEKLQTVDWVTMLKKSVTNCPFDNTKLIFKKCNLNYYSSDKKKMMMGKIMVRALYCPKCNNYFVNHNILYSFSNKRVITKELKKAKNKPVIEKHTDKHNLKVSTKGYNFSTEIHPNNKSNRRQKHEINLNNQSELRVLGYSTLLSRDERWQILVNKAIPKIGVRRTMNLIAWLIRLKKSDTTKDYSRAIGEWEYDLNKLKRNYT